MITYNNLFSLLKSLFHFLPVAHIEILNRTTQIFENMIHGWWHKFVRGRTKPIRPEDAIKWKRRLSIAYGLCAWHAFGFVVYAVATGKSDWAHYYGFKSDEEKAIPPGKAWAATLGIPNAKVYRISGMRKVDEYDIVEGEEVRNGKNDDTISEDILTE